MPAAEFIESPSFTKEAAELLDEHGLMELMSTLSLDLEAGDLIPGGGGIRKIRIARPGTGKRGGGRVIYYAYSPLRLVYLLAIYAKNERGNLTKAQAAYLSGLAKSLREASAAMLEARKKSPWKLRV